MKLRAKGITGIVRIANIDIEITPKFLSVVDGSWQIVLWRILTVVEGGYIDDDLTTANQLKSMSMPDLLAEIFLRSYSKGAGRGLPRGYLVERGLAMFFGETRYYPFGRVGFKSMDTSVYYRYFK